MKHSRFVYIREMCHHGAVGRAAYALGVLAAVATLIYFNASEAVIVGVLAVLREFAWLLVSHHSKNPPGDGSA